MSKMGQLQRLQCPFEVVVISNVGELYKGLICLVSAVKIDLTLRDMKQKITAFGKVRWNKIIIENESYEAGVEFVNTPSEAIKKLQDYISWKMAYKKIKA